MTGRLAHKRQRAVSRVLAAWLVGALALVVCPDHVDARRPPKDTPQTRANAAYDAAQQAFRDGRYQDAVGGLETAYRLHPNPLFLYNLGRVREKLGQLQEAHRNYLKLLVVPGLTPQVRRLADERIAALKSIVGKAVMRFDGESSAIVQLDGRLVPEPGRDRAVTPGTHQLCVIAAAKTARCWRRELPVGMRTRLPIDSPSQTRAHLVWTPAADVERVILDGHRLMLDVSRTWQIEVDAGKHVLETVGARSTKEHVDLVPGRTRPFLMLEGDGRDADPIKATSVRGTDPWPWITVGLGGATAAGGAVLMAVAAGKRSEISDRPTPDLKDGQEVRDETTWNATETNTNVGIALVAAGGATVLGGVIWWLVSGDSGAEPVVRVGFQPSGLITVEGGF